MTRYVLKVNFKILDHILPFFISCWYPLTNTTVNAMKTAKSTGTCKKITTVSLNIFYLMLLFNTIIIINVIVIMAVKKLLNARRETIATPDAQKHLWAISKIWKSPQLKSRYHIKITIERKLPIQIDVKPGYNTLKMLKKLKSLYPY